MEKKGFFLGIIIFGKVVDSISSISATFEELSASSENSLQASRECKEHMDEMNAILDKIHKITSA